MKKSLLLALAVFTLSASASNEPEPVPSTTAGDIELIFSCEQNKVTSDYKNAQGEQGSSSTSGDLSKG